LFKVYNLAADLRALGAEDGNNVFAHSPNLVPSPMDFLHRLRPNIAKNREYIRPEYQHPYQQPYQQFERKKR
jgi:hypothetical protein